MFRRESQNETDQFIGKLSKEASTPEAKFKVRLKDEMMREFNSERPEDKLSFSFLAMRNMKTATAALGTLVVALGVVGATGTVGYLLYKNLQEDQGGGGDQIYIEAVSAAEKPAVLAKVLSNNPENILSPTYTSSSSYKTSEVTDAEGTDQASDVFSAQFAEFNYSYSKTETEVGPAASSCPIYSYVTSMPVEFESYDFYGNDINYYKSVGKDQDGDLYDYYLGNWGSTSSESLEYKGGKYAVRSSWTYEAPLDYEADEPLEDVEEIGASGDTGEEFDIEDLATDYFGPDSDVDKYFENGKLKYYVVTWSYDISCDEDQSYKPVAVNTQPEDKATNKLIIKSWFEPNSYISVRDEEYLDLEAADNLLVRTVNTVENKQAEFSEVKDVFQFEYDVEVRDLNYDDVTYIDPYEDREAYRQAVDEYLRENPMDVLTTVDSKFTLQYAFLPYDSTYDGTDPIEDAWADRDFYPEGPKGDEMYKEATEPAGYNNPLLDLSYYVETDINSSIVVTAFPEGTTQQQLLNWYLYLTDYEKSETAVTVDGQDVSAVMYTGSSEIVALEETVENEAEGSGVESIGETDYIVIFEYGQNTYVISSFSENGTDYVSGIQLKSYDTSDASERNKVVEIVESTLEEEWHYYEDFGGSEFGEDILDGSGLEEPVVKED